MHSPRRGSFLLFVGTFLLAAAAAAQDNVWTTRPSIPTGRSRSAAAVYGSELFVAGGYGPAKLSSFTVYNVATGAWVSTTSVPNPRYAGVGAQTIGSKIYLPGGWQTTLPTNTLYSYDVIAGTWSTLANLPGLAGCGTSGAIGSKLYVTVGCNGVAGYRQTLYSYDAALTTWATLANSATSHYEGAGAAIGTKFYVAGGFNGGSQHSILEVYDPAGPSWTTLSKGLPTARYGTVGAAYNNRLFVIGGYDGTAQSSKVEAYDPAANTWLCYGDLPEARQLPSAAVIGSTIVVVGGDGPSGYSNVVYAIQNIKPLAPAAPTLVSTVTGTTSITWGWTDGCGETAVWLVDGTSYTSVSGHLNADTTSYLETGLSPNRQYSRRVIPLNDGGSSTSTAVSRYTLAAVPGITGSAGVGSGGVIFSANGNPSGTVYEVERSTDGVSFFSVVASTQGSYFEEHLLVETTYYYRARAKNGENVYTAYSAVEAVYVPAITNDDWISRTQLPSARNKAASAVLGDKIWVAGGYTGSTALSELITFAGATQDWSASTAMPATRYNGDGAAFVNGKLYVPGGWNGGLPTNSLYSFDPATGAWSTLATLPALSGCGTTSVVGGKLYVTSGCNGSAGYRDHFFSYDPGGNSWSTLTNSPSAHYEGAAGAISGKVYVAGGVNGAGAIHGQLDVYDPAGPSWTTITKSMPTPRHGTAGVVLSGKLFVLGGHSGSSYLSNVESYDPAADTWSCYKPLTTPRMLPIAEVLGSTIVVAGGDENGFVTSHTLAIQNPSPVAPAASSPAATPVSSTSIRWSWSDPCGETAVQLSSTHTVSGPLAYDTTSYTENGLTPNTFYQRRVAAWNGAGSSTSAFAGAYTLAAVPASLIATEVHETSATLTWAANGNPAGTSFELQRSTGTTFVTISSAAVLTATDLSLADLTTYYYRVRAFNAAGTASAFTSTTTVVTDETAPLTPGTPVATALGVSSISWTWTLSDGATAHFLYRASDLASLGALAAPPFAQTGLAVNTAYGLRVAGKNSIGLGPLSAPATAYTQAAVPAALTATGVHISSAVFSWSANGNPAGTTYELQRSSQGSWANPFTLASGAVLTGTDLSILPLTTYYYRVRAFNGDGVPTVFTSTISVLAAPQPPPDPPGTPAGTALGVSSISWTWSLATGATAYFPYRTSDGLSLGSVAAPPFAQTGLAPNTAYGLQVKGKNITGAGPISASATAYTLAAAPSGLAATWVSSTALTIAWGLNGNPASPYAELEASDDGTTYSTLSTGPITSFTKFGLLGCTTYYYRARNLGAGGSYTAYSSALQAVTGNTVPDEPGAFSAESAAGGKVALTWTASPTEGVTGYRLYYDAGDGSVDYGAPLAVFTSTETSWLSGVMTSSASYTFALRAVHRCGVETAAFAAAGAQPVLAAVRAVIKSPDAGKTIKGNRVTVTAELVAGAPSDVSQVRFQYRAVGAASWLDLTAANVNHPNPDVEFPYFVHVNADLLAPGSYELRAVASDLTPTADPAPSAVTVTVVTANADIDENLDIDGKVKKDQVVSNAVTTTLKTSGVGADDPAVSVVLPPGAVTASTATCSVIANPVITTSAPSGLTAVGSAVSIRLSNGQSNLGASSRITLTYPDTVTDPSRLAIYWLNEATGVWSKEFASTVDTSCRTVSGLTPHFSIFAVLAGAPAATSVLDSVRVYPVPWKPHGSNPDEGGPGIVFDTLPAGARIKIYTISGRLVAETADAGSTGSVRWDGRNRDGRDAASGGYFAVIAAPGAKSVTRKVVIIR